MHKTSGINASGMLSFLAGTICGIALTALTIEFCKSRAARADDRAAPPSFVLHDTGVLEWPGKLKISHGGGEQHALPALEDAVRAQPGGNIVLEPQGDAMRSAIDLLPAKGRPVDLDAIGEFTIHRRHPTIDTHEMISFSALGRRQNVYAIVVEAHGEGELRPLVFMTVQGGLRNPAEAFSAEAMRITEQGTVVLGLQRQGGKTPRPLDSLTIEQPEPTAPGAYDSDALQWVGKSHDGKSSHRSRWRSRVDVVDEAGRSSLTVASSRDDGPETSRMHVSDRGDLALPTPGSAVVMTSPNGARWRLTVSDTGKLEVSASK